MADQSGWTPVAPLPPAAPPTPAPDGWTPVASYAADRPADFQIDNAPGLADRVGSAITHGWEVANTPLVPQIATAAQALGEHLGLPRIERPTLMRRILAATAGLPNMTDTQAAEGRGFAAGAIPKAGAIAASFTSPLGILLTVLGIKSEGVIAEQLPALKTALELPAVRTLTRSVQATSGAGFVAQSAKQTYDAPDVAGKLAGIGGMAAGLAGVASGLSAPRPAGVGAVPRLTAPEIASNEFAAAHEIPLDAATATGSRAMRGLQKRTANSIGGEGTAERLIYGQQQALGRVGRELVDQTHPTSVTPEQAGQGARDAMTGSARSFNDLASTEYEKLRAIEQDPQHVQTVHTAPVGSRAYRGILTKLGTGITDAAGHADPELRAWAQTVGSRAPTLPELAIMRQIEAELSAQPYTPYLLQPQKYGGALEHVEGTGGAGAPVFDEVKQAAPGTARIDRGEMEAAIRKTLETGEWTNASRGAYKVAQDRAAASGALTGPRLNPGAPILGTTTEVGMPVDLTVPKQRLQPLYDRLKREAELVPLQGDKARALVALDRLISGPDIESASIVDAALGDLKSMARSDIPELRTQGQGLAAAAVTQIEQAVQKAVTAAGPAAVDALATGRQATIAKYRALEVSKNFTGDPTIGTVGTFKQLTAPQDANVGLLRRVQEFAPERMPELARAKLEAWMDFATETERFGHVDRIYKEWRSLGPDTKRILFSAPGHVQALDQFFLLAKRIAENPNPSGTGAVNNAFNWTTTLPSYVAAKVLYTPRGVRAITQLLRVTPRGSAAAQTAATVQTAAQRAAWAEVAAAARSAGVPLTFPKAADTTAPDPDPATATTTGTRSR